MNHNPNQRPCHHLTSVVRRMNPALPRVLFNHQYLLLRKQRRRVEMVNLCSYIESREESIVKFPYVSCRLFNLIIYFLVFNKYGIPLLQNPEYCE